MSDPVSIATGLVGLLSVLRKATNAIVDFLKGCREARDDLGGVRAELSTMTEVLNQLQREGNANRSTITSNHWRSLVQPAVDNCRRDVTKITNLLERHSGRRGAAWWALDGKKEVSNLRESLRSHREALVLVMTVVTHVSTQSIGADTSATRAHACATEAHAAATSAGISAALEALAELLRRGESNGPPPIEQFQAQPSQDAAQSNPLPCSGQDFSGASSPFAETLYADNFAMPNQHGGSLDPQASAPWPAPEVAEEMAMLPHTYDWTAPSSGDISTWPAWPDTDVLALHFVNTGKIVNIYDLFSGELVRKLDTKSDLNMSTLSGNGRCLVTVSESGKVKIWDLQDGKCVQQISEKNPYRILCSADGKYVASICSQVVMDRPAGTQLRIWDIAKGKVAKEFSVSECCYGRASLSPDGYDLAVPTGRDVTIWNKASIHRFGRLQGHTDTVGWVGYSPNGKKLATVSADSKIKIWDARTCRLLRTVGGRRVKESRGVVFSPDGLLIASNAFDDEVRIWNVNTGTCNQTVKTRRQTIETIGFSRDSSQVLIFYVDRLEFWDIANKRRIYKMLYKLSKDSEHDWIQYRPVDNWACPQY